MQEIKAIFFDLDDTLINSREAEYDASIEFKKQFEEFNEIDNNYFANLWHKIAAKQYERYSRGEISYEKNKMERIKALFSIVNIEKEDEEAAEIFKKYLRLYEKNWAVFDDTIEVLESLKSKYKLGMITNGDKNQQNKKLILTKLKEFFETVIISGEIGISKPNQKIFEIACKEIKEDPKNCIMVGDNYKLDIQGAQNYGLNAIWINRKNEEFEFKNQIKELKELINYLL